ncbi:unnamed protein product [Tilletia controversa]|nr:unnamed protein product [Tilletia controversa]
MAPLTSTTPIPGPAATIGASAVELPTINVPGDDSNVSSLTDLPSGSQEPSMESLPALVQSLLLQVGELKSRVVDAEGGRSESRSRLVEPHRSVPGRPSTPAQQIHALHSTPLDRPPPPHMTGSKSSAALLSFQRQTGPDKQVVREVLERMGTSIYDVSIASVETPDLHGPMRPSAPPSIPARPPTSYPPPRILRQPRRPTGSSSSGRSTSRRSTVTRSCLSAI